MKANRWLWNELRAVCDLDKRWGRRRERGHWELITVAFVVSDYADIQPWHDDSSEELWRACGFTAKPHYRTNWRRLRELADVSDEFLIATGKLLRRARAQDPRVMAHVHFDSTEDETHAALVHDCEPDQCPRRGRGHASGRGRAGAAQRPVRQTTKTFREERQKLNALDPETAKREQTEHEPARVELVQEGSRMVKRVKIGECWYRTLDTEAGIRAYMGPRGARRFWHAYYSGKAVRHIPRSRHCGGPTTFVRFSQCDRSKPVEQRKRRIWFDCANPATPACSKTRTIDCSTDYRLLIPLWRTNALYHELKASRSTCEGAHDWWRDRYKVATDDLGMRPKVRDISFHPPRERRRFGRVAAHLLSRRMAW